MSWDQCVEAVRAAAGRPVTDDEIDDLLTRVQLRIDRLKRERVDLSAAELAHRAAAEIGAEAEMAARIEIRNRKMNLQKRMERRGFYDSADPVLAMEEKLVGGNTPLSGARLSVGAQQKALARDYTSGLGLALQRAGLFRWTKQRGNERALARELWELSRDGGEPGSSGDRFAQQAASIIHPVQEAARLGLNRAGAWIGQYDGWITRTAHDADKIRRAGFERWRELIEPALDERTFEGIEDRSLFLRRIYNGLVTGIHLTSEGMQGFKDPAFTGPGNLAKKLSQGRVLHFRDADSWLDYHQAFGGRSLMETIMGGLDRAARDTALMREFGTNPRAEWEADLRFMAESWRDRDQAVTDRITAAGSWLTNRFDELDGTAQRPVNRHLARLGSMARLTQSMAKLGGAVLTAITDVPMKAAELRYQGIGLLQGYGDSLTSLVRGRGRDADTREVIDLLRAGTEGMRGDLMSRFDYAADGVPGMMTDLANLHFKITGLTYWTDAQRAGAELIMSRHLGSLADTAHADLPPKTRRILDMFGVSDREWDALRRTDLFKDRDGRAFVTPDRARMIGDEGVDAILGPRLDDLRAAALGRLEADMGALDRLESRLGRLEALAGKPLPNARDVERIDIRSTLAAWRKQLGAVSKMRDRVVEMRDGKATTNQTLATIRDQVQKLVDAEKRIAAKAAVQMERLAARIPVAEARHAEALAAIEQVKAEMVRRIERIDALPDRLAEDVERMRTGAREDLALKLHAYFSDRGEYAVLNPGAREHAILRQGTRRGTPIGEALRFVTQFKAFPTAMISKAWGREIYGGDTGIERVAGIAHMMVAATLFGYLAMVAKDLSRTKSPRDPTDPGTWAAAFLQGGGAGIYGDFFMGRANRFGNSAAETAIGPSLGAAFELVNIWNGVRAGDDKSAAMLRWTVQNTPYLNLWYTRAALDHLFLNQVQEALNPGYLRRFERRVQEDTGQTFWLRPTEAVGVR